MKNKNIIINFNLRWIFVYINYINIIHCIYIGVKGGLLASAPWTGYFLKWSTRRGGTSEHDSSLCLCLSVCLSVCLCLCVSVSLSGAKTRVKRYFFDDAATCQIMLILEAKRRGPASQPYFFDDAARVQEPLQNMWFLHFWRSGGSVIIRWLRCQIMLENIAFGDMWQITDLPHVKK